MNKKFLFFLFILFLSLNVFALTTSDANYSGGIYNGGFEYGSGEGLTSASWIGDKNYGWYRNGTGTFKVTYLGFDNTKFHSGTQSMKIDVNGIDSNSIAGTSDIGLFNTGGYPQGTLFLTTADGRFSYVFRIKPSTNYKLMAWVDINKLEYTLASGNRTISAGCFITEYSLTGTRLSSQNLFAQYSATTNGNFVNISDLGLTNVNSYYGILSCGTNSLGSGAFTDGNVVANFDDVRLEEVATTNLSGQVSGRPSIVVTGVSDFNAIDQADTNNSSVFGMGQVINKYSCQSFTPTKNNLQAVIFQRGTTLAGDFKGDVNFYIADKNTASSPGTTRLAETVYTNAQYLALPTGTDIRIPLVTTLDANGTNQYWFCIATSTADNVNYINLRSDSGVSYSGGKRYRSADSSSWTDISGDMYFKTLFEKQSSAFDLNVCSSGDSVCEFKTYNIDFLENDENYLITPANAPLFYQGDNNVYFMMHSDSDYNNKTPSMITNLLYTFDKPTTTLTRSKGSNDNEEIITLTCTNGLTGNCDNTYYSYNGVSYFTYASPITLANGTYTLRYYSTADNNNIESVNTSTLVIPTQGSQATCTIVDLFPILLIFIGISSVLGVIATKKTMDSGSLNSLVTYIIGLIIAIVLILQFLPILC